MAAQLNDCCLYLYKKRVSVALVFDSSWNSLVLSCLVQLAFHSPCPYLSGEVIDSGFLLFFCRFLG